MKLDIRKAIITAAAGVSLVVAGAFAAPAEAQAGGKHVAGAFLGGVVAGAIIGAHSRPAYGAPVYRAPVYVAPAYGVPAYGHHHYRKRCHWERQRVWHPGHGRSWQKVRVCY